MYLVKNKFKQIANKENITLREILGLFTCQSVSDLMCVLKEDINDNFDVLNVYKLGNVKPLRFTVIICLSTKLFIFLIT